MAITPYAPVWRISAGTERTAIVGAPLIWFGPSCRHSSLILAGAHIDKLFDRHALLYRGFVFAPPSWCESGGCQLGYGTMLMVWI